MSPRARAVHRLLGLSLALPLAVWAVTGILFHVKHRYGEAYESLRVPVLWPDVAAAHVSPADLVASGLVDAGTGALPRLAVHTSGRLVWLGARGDKSVALDAATGDPIAAASEADARRWAEAAVLASKNAGRYGAITSAESVTRHSPMAGAESPAFRFAFSGGKHVTVDRVTGEIEQTGALNDWIDATYRLHYLQLTPWKPVNVALVLIAIPALLLLAATGFRLFLYGAWQDRPP